MILIAASILAARKLAQYDGGKRVPATMSAIADALVDRCVSIPNPPKPLVCTTTTLGHGDSTIYCTER